MNNTTLILAKLDELVVQQREIVGQQREIVAHLRDLNTLAERRERDRERKRNFRGQNSVRGQKENEEGKENLPPTPPIREKGEGKEKVVVVESRAREANESDLEKLLHSDALSGKRIPSLTQVMAFVETALGKTKAPRDRVEEWYRKTLLAKWEDGDGNPIKNWGRNLNMFLFYYDRNQKSADPACLPDARQRGISQVPQIKHADNWRGTNPEDIENVLG